MNRRKFDDLALRALVRILDLDDLHFGVFEGQARDLAGLRAAQEKYSEMIVLQVPAGVKRILDVGCGTGALAERLVLAGFEVTCVTPDPELASLARPRLPASSSIHVTGFEEFSSPDRFDLVLMAESCQYIKARACIERSKALLVPGGFLLVADVFRVRPLDQPWLSKAGHRYLPFLERARRSGLIAEVDLDITEMVAPTLDIYQDLIRRKIVPSVDLFLEGAARHFPILFRIARLLLGRRVRHLRSKYLHQGADDFRRYRTYRVLRFKNGPKGS